LTSSAVAEAARSAIKESRKVKTKLKIIPTRHGFVRICVDRKRRR
jgi:hypothetical protein